MSDEQARRSAAAERDVVLQNMRKIINDVMTDGREALNETERDQFRALSDRNYELRNIEKGVEG